MFKVCEEHRFINHVNSIITFACCWYVYMPFNYILSLLVIVWLHLVPTSITGIRGNQTVHKGDNLRLACEALGQPKPNVTWSKEKPGNQGNTVVVQEGKVLTITNINRTDAGDYIPVQHTMALVNQRIEQFMWLLLVSMHWKKLWLMLNTDAISLYYFLCSNVCCHLIECINIWLSTSMLSSKLNFLFFFNLLVNWHLLF